MTQKLYVTFQKQTYSELDEIEQKYVQFHRPPLGYAAVYNPGNDKNEKKNKDQWDWARYKKDENGEYIVEDRKPRLDENGKHMQKWVDSQFYREGGFYAYCWDEVTYPLAEELKPRVVDNVARSGFKIVATVTRWSTSNKLWRILDPYGFELEISTANMEEILMGGVIDKGEIIGECIWDFGKNGIGKAKLVRIYSQE